MTRKTAAQIKAHWPLVVILAAVFWSGYQYQGETAEARDKAIGAVEQRMGHRISRLEDQLDRTNGLLFKIWVELKRR